MTLVVLRPSATPSSPSDPSYTGGASIADALSDNSDGSYVTFLEGQSTTVNLGDLVLPAGAVIKRGDLRIRFAGGFDPSGYDMGNLEVLVSATGGPRAGGTVAPPAATPSTINAGAASGWTLAEVNGATLTLTGVSNEIRVYEFYFDVTYVAKPVVTVQELGA